MHSAQPPAADVVVHLHPQTSCDDRDRIERELRRLPGVVAIKFEDKDHPHAMVVQYDANVLNSQDLLTEIRKCDRDAVMAGL